MSESTADETAVAPRFHPLVFNQDGDEVTVGRIDTGTFVALPADGAALLRKLVDGTPPPVAARWYADTYGESVDIAEFAADLDELGFLLADGEAPAAPMRLRWTRLAAVLFSPVAAVLYVALLAAWVWVTLTGDDLAPTYHHLFFTHYMSVVMVTMFLGQLPLVLLHEAAHALAGRRLGLPSKLSLSRRLYFLVFQTTLDGLVSVPRRKRFVPLLAGLFVDVGAMAVLTLLAAWLRDGGTVARTVAAIALGLAYLTLLRVVWQFWFFLQTDIYHLVVTILGCVDLHVTARAILANRWAAVRGRPRPHDPDLWHPRDQAVGRWYSVLIVLGYAFMIAVLVTSMVPAAGHAFGTVLGALFAGGESTGQFVDGLVFLFLSVGEIVLAGVLHLRERRRAGA
ncbi:hypothetical protein [Actinokineospora enzanensis]|uniref:hypothetical protein n=1 Tax=Actinokineospora enzanensis TaxID=155975 RepID=UPI00037810D0|nr:hypothetical protein [Actinokineospora enzanensis]